MIKTETTKEGTKMTMESTKQMMRENGFTPSPCSWEDKDMLFVFSEELVNGNSFEGSKQTITVRKDIGSVFVQ